jgi:hypothetical protein
VLQIVTQQVDPRISTASGSERVSISIPLPMLIPFGTGNSDNLGARQVFAHTHLVRGGFLMLQPTTGRRTAEEAPAFPHTHLVRGGFGDVTAYVRNLWFCRAQPVGASRAQGKVWGTVIVGFSIIDPPLTRWVCAKGIGVLPRSASHCRL